jgi:hypothetical protein
MILHAERQAEISRSSELSAALTLARVFRGHMPHRRIALGTKCALILQRVYRSRLGRRCFDSMRLALQQAQHRAHLYATAL